MIRSRIFQKHFAMALGILILFLVLGFYFTDYIMKSFAPRREMIPPVFMAKVVDRLNPQDKVKAVQELVSMHTDDRVPSLILFNDQGQALYPSDASIDFNWNEVQKPAKVYDYTWVNSNRGPPPSQVPIPHLPLGPKPGLAPGPGGPHGLSALIRLSGEPATYLYMGHPKGPPPGEKPPAFMPFIALTSLVVSLLLGVGTSLSLIYYSVNKNVKLADTVISELQKGNLKARFPVHRKDEFGQAMIRFNRMADEIENLVEHLRSVEAARTKLLQELAHDLRTPIASLKSLLETMHFRKEQLDAKIHEELMTLSLSEVEYFERLVEDLLFLAQVNEPRYQAKKELVSLNDLISEEADNCALRYSQSGKIHLEKIFQSQDLRIQGDLILLRRLFRNALENAFSFARSKVIVRLRSSDDGKVHFVIEDDGPGFSQESLKSFGERRISRKLEATQGSRVSVGLGSVVMKTIALAHRGEVRASNRTASTGQIEGARVEATLPLQS